MHAETVTARASEVIHAETVTPPAENVIHAETVTRQIEAFRMAAGLSTLKR